MADTNEAVRRLTIQSTTQGVDESTAKLKQLSGAFDGVTVASSSTEKATLSAEGKFAALERRFSTLSAQQSAFDKIQRTVNTALSQNPALAERAAAVLAAAEARYSELNKAANDNNTALGFNRSQLLELGHAAKATFEQVAAGAPALTILSQQGASAAQALSSGSGGLGGSLLAIGRGILSFLGPIGTAAAAFLALGAAAGVYFNIVKKDGPTVEETFKEQDRLLGVIKASYDEVTKATTRWYNQSKDVTQLQLLQQQIDLQSKLRDEVGKTIQTLTKPADLGGTALFGAFGAKGANVVKDQFAPFEDAIIALQQSYKAGAPDVKAFNDEVARIALADPSLQKAAAGLITATAGSAKFANSLEQVNAALKSIAGGTLSTQERGILGLPDIRPEQISAYQQLIEKTRDRIEELKLEAETAGQTSDAVLKLKLQHDAERAAKKSGVQVNQEELDGLKEEIALRTRLAALADIKAQIQFDKDTQGLSPEDAQIAQTLRKVYPDVTTAINSTEAANIRLNNSFKAGQEIVSSFGNELVSGLLRGEDAMKSLESAATSLIAKLSSQNLTRFLNGGSLFGNQSLNSAQGAVGIASAGLGGYASGNPLTGALGGALAGATFGPAGAAIGGVVGAIGGLIGQSHNAEAALKQAQDAWKAMGSQVTAFNAAAAGSNVGPMVNMLAKKAASNDNKKDDRNDCDEHHKAA